MVDERHQTIPETRTKARSRCAFEKYFSTGFTASGQ
jgi:hypothetical protein